MTGWAAYVVVGILILASILFALLSRNGK